MTNSRPSHETKRSSRWNRFVASLLADVVDEHVQKALTDQRAALDARVAASVEPVLAWIRRAEAHLAALQKDHERLRERHDRLTALFEERMSQLDRLAAGAEDHERLRERHDRLTALFEERMSQLDRLAAGAGWLETRLEDLERADTAIATALAKARIHDELQ